MPHRLDIDDLPRPVVQSSDMLVNGPCQSRSRCVQELCEGGSLHDHVMLQMKRYNKVRVVFARVQ